MVKKPHFLIATVRIRTEDIKKILSVVEILNNLREDQGCSIDTQIDSEGKDWDNPK